MCECETDWSHLAFGCSFNFIAPGQSKSPLLLSAKFSANASLTIFSASSALLLQTEMDTASFLFSKAFELILQHVLRNKMRALYVVIFFVTC